MLQLPIQDTVRSPSRSNSKLLQSVEWVRYRKTRWILTDKCCVACRLPGDVNSPAGFWEMLLNQES